MNIILTSFAPIESEGGVPRWNRDFCKYFREAKHYSWDYVVKKYGDTPLTEWEKAKVLNSLLLKDKLIKDDDIVITDGFWGLGLEKHKNVISVCHGHWSQLSYDEVKKGKQSLFPYHNAVQVKYRGDLLKRNGKLVSVSDFVKEDMIAQWGYESDVINNAIDTTKFTQRIKTNRSKPLIIHGAITHKKGTDHIDFIKSKIKNVDIVLLNDEYDKRNKTEPKHRIIADADLVVSPSTYEGNSYFILETLACNVPIVAYDTGLLHSYYAEKYRREIIGEVESILKISNELTLEMTLRALDSINKIDYYQPRQWVSKYDISSFWHEWEVYLANNFNYKKV